MFDMKLLRRYEKPTQKIILKSFNGNDTVGSNFMEKSQSRH